MKEKAVKIRALMVFIVLALLTTSAWAVIQNGQNAGQQDKPAGQTKEVELPPAVRPNTDTLALIRRRGELRVGVSLFVPWSIRKKDGDLAGYEIDVAEKMAEDMGVKVKFVPVPFKELINDLVDDRFDIIISGLYVTPQRSVFVNFSEPSGASEVTILASRKDGAAGRSLEDFNKAGVKVGAVTGTVYADLAKDKLPHASLQTFSEEGEMLNALGEGNLQAVIATSPIPEIVAHVHPDKFFLPLSSPIAHFGESFAIRKGDADFLNYLNTWIRFYNETGWLKERRQYWFKDLKWANSL